MNKRTFLKLITCLPAFPLVSLCRTDTKQYVTQCPWSDVIGMRVEWPACIANDPYPGRDWEITSQAPDPIEYMGDTILNHQLDKFWIKPVGLDGPFKLCWIAPMRREDGITDYSTADLRWGRFYRCG